MILREQSNVNAQSNAREAFGSMQSATLPVQDDPSSSNDQDFLDPNHCGENDLNGEILQILEVLMELIEEIEEQQQGHGGCGNPGNPGNPGDPGNPGGRCHGGDGGSGHYFDNFNIGDVGDPHISASGNGPNGLQFNQKFDDMKSLYDLASTNINGGEYRVSTEVGSPINDKGTTLNKEAAVHYKGDTVSVTAGGQTEITLADGEKETLKAGSSVTLGNGLTVSESADGKTTTISEQGSNPNQKISTTITQAGSSHGQDYLNVNVSGSDCDVHGAAVNGPQAGGPPPRDPAPICPEPIFPDPIGRLPFPIDPDPICPEPIGPEPIFPNPIGRLPFPIDPEPICPEPIFPRPEPVLLAQSSGARQTVLA